MLLLDICLKKLSYTTATEESRGNFVLFYICYVTIFVSYDVSTLYILPCGKLVRKHVSLRKAMLPNRAWYRIEIR